MSEPLIPVNFELPRLISQFTVVRVTSDGIVIVSSDLTFFKIKTQ